MERRKEGKLDQLGGMLMKVIYKLFFMVLTISVCFAGSIHEDVIHTQVSEEGKTISADMLMAGSDVSGGVTDSVGYILGAIIKILLGEA
ncbi:hypothetical protein [Microbulbifer sp. TRSA007]|uniref:hypothetical protein n=1 Tax=Microbulbifer sp. TRSA007 TaxID=3243384 RepID=UPI00403A0A0C